MNCSHNQFDVAGVVLGIFGKLQSNRLRVTELSRPLGAPIELNREPGCIGQISNKETIYSSKSCGVFLLFRSKVDFLTEHPGRWMARHEARVSPFHQP